MSNLEHYLATEDLHPIDLVETLAEHHDWDFERIAEDQIAMSIEGQWRTYSITLAWSAYDETLRMVVTFEMDPPEDKMPALYEILNLTNDRCWTGAFTYWEKQKLMVYRYGLLLGGGAGAGPDQVDQMVSTAITAAERFYPAFQLAVWGNDTPEQAMKVAIAQGYGRA
jgi:hypothetical protein